MAVMAAIGARYMDKAPEVRLHRFGNLGAIDLRVDYLRPGIGDYFDLHAGVIRLGARVASARMEFRGGADGKLLSTGRGYRSWRDGQGERCQNAPFFYIRYRREAVAGPQGIGLTLCPL